MSLDNLLSKVALLSGLSLCSYNCQTSTPDPTSCSKDTDCKGDRICVQGLCQTQSTYGGDVKSSSNTNTKLYFWEVGNCEVGKTKEDFMTLLQNNSAQLVRSFSKTDLDPSTPKPACYNPYICALSKNPSLYAIKTNKGVRLVDNLLLETSQEYPGKDECQHLEWVKPWYKDCFVKSSDCPEP